MKAIKIQLQFIVNILKIIISIISSHTQSRIHWGYEPVKVPSKQGNLPF